jgi:hypothetical protein
MNVRTDILQRPSPLRHDAGSIIATRLVATLAMTTIMYVVPLVGLGREASFYGEPRPGHLHHRSDVA